MAEQQESRSPEEMESYLRDEKERKQREWHELALERFKCAVDAEQDTRNTSQEEQGFERGDQWPDAVRQLREGDRGGARPCLTINRLPAFKRRILNELKQIRPQIKIRPVDSSADPKTAEIYDGMIRAIEEDCNADSAYMWGASNCVSVGWGYWRVITKWDGEEFDQRIVVKRIRNQYSVFLDPGREEVDGSDASYGFIVEQIPEKEFKQRYPGKHGGITSDARAELKDFWFSGETVSVAEYWEVENEVTGYAVQMPDGQIINITQEQYDLMDIPPARARPIIKPVVYQSVISGTETLEKRKKQPGRYVPIIEMRGTEEIVDGKVYFSGYVRDAMDPQRQYNYFRSAGVEKTALEPKAPFIGYRGQFQSPAWKKANTHNLAYLEATFPEGWPSDRPLPLPQRQPGPQTNPGFTEQVAMSAQELQDVIGIQDPAMGAGKTHMPADAVQQWRSESDTGQYHYADGLKTALRHTARVLIAMIPDVYSGDRMVRIVDGQTNSRMAVIGQTPIDGMEPRDIRIGRYDSVVDLGPSYATKRKESQHLLMELGRNNPEWLNLMGDLIVSLADVQNADEMTKRLRTLLPPHILASENPEVDAVVQQYEAQMAQLQEALQYQQQQMSALQQMLQNKDGEIRVKEEDLKRKIMDDLMNWLHANTELELKYQQNVPGSAV